MTRPKYETSPVQLCLDLQQPKPLKYCNNPPQRLGQDQYRCLQCGIVWDIDEARPPCQTSSLQPQEGNP